MIKFSFVIPIRNRRKNTLDLVNDNLATLNNIEVPYEIIIVEDSVSSGVILKQDIGNDRVSYYKVDTGIEEWSKAILMNYGARVSSGSYFVMTDADSMFKNGFWESVATHMGDGSEDIVYQFDNWQIGAKRKFWYWFIVPIKLFRAMNGFDEQLVNWGGEDQLFIERVKLLGVPLVNLTAINPKLIGWHKPHGDDLRNPPGLKIIQSGQRNWIVAKKNIKKFTARLTNQKNWGLGPRLISSFTTKVE